MSTDSYAGFFSRFFIFRLLPNAPSERAPPPGTTTSGGTPAIVEFDDQGICFDRGAVDRLTAALAGLEGATPIIIIFVHGWKHNAAESDGNLVSFRKPLAETAAEEVTQPGGGRPVLGVYLSWRGLSRDGNWTWTQSSFWDRQEAAQRVAQGATREVLGRLKAFRNGNPGDKPRATLIVVGHSFGGLIVHTAIAQSLIEAVASQDRVIPSFGDLVLLVNPAFSAISYLPIVEIAAARTFDPEQLPVCVSVTALNDWATGYAYPLGRCCRLLTEAWRGPRERAALINTMGHLDWMRTHALTMAPGAAAAPEPAESASSRARDRTAAVRLTSEAAAMTLGAVMVQPVAGAVRSPFWVASATPAIINGHNGIFTTPFIGFVRALIRAHLAQDAKRESPATASHDVGP